MSVIDDVKAEVLDYLGKCDFLNMSFDNHVAEVPSMDIWRIVEPTGEFTVTIRARRPRPEPPPDDTIVGIEFPDDVSSGAPAYVTTHDGATLVYGDVSLPQNITKLYSAGICGECKGTGEYLGLTTVEKCGTCGGSGKAK